MQFIRVLRRTLRLRLIKLEEAKFNAYVKTFRFLRDKILEDSDVSDKASRQERWHAKDIESGEKITEESETILFTEVGKALSCWAALEEMLVSLAHLLLTTSIQKAGVVMYSIINFGAWLGIITELFPHEELYTHLKPKWDKLTGRLRALKDIRDRLAHHSAFKADVPAAIFNATSIAPSPYDVRAKSLKHRPLTVHEVREFYEGVREIMKDLTALILEMEAVHAAYIVRLDAEIDRISGPNAYDKAVAALRGQAETKPS